MSTLRKIKSLVVCLCVFSCPAFSQNTFFGEVPVKWQNYTIPETSVNTDNYSSSDLVILNDETEFNFYSMQDEKIIRNITFKINSEKGIEKLKSYRLPESFDPAFDSHYNKQGRAARIKSPYTTEFVLQKFAARKYSANRWKEIPFDLKYEKMRWICTSGDFAGEFKNEDLSVFTFQNLAVGDLVQVVYEATFSLAYGNNLFYFHSSYPKLHCKYTFAYKMDTRFADYLFVMPVNVPDSLITNDRETSRDYGLFTNTIEFKDLGAVNYPSNSFEGCALPHVFADFRFYRKLSGNYPSGGGRIYEFEPFRPRNFEWVVIADTANLYTKVYDKQFTSLRKFMAKMPPYTNNDSASKLFFKALCDTFNNFRFITSNQLVYNESNLKDVYSGDHLLKRRLVENMQWKLYKDILNDNKVFYHVANIQDRRFGEHNPSYRASYAYEKELIAIPSKDSYIYFMPRYYGMKYHLNELPFYLEGSLALLNPQNFQDHVKNKDDQFFKFIRTHRGTCIENSRTENATVRIVLDSLKADLMIKESLSGQFSTVLRHLYLNENIDSTIATHYFKKCIEKPFASNPKIKLSSKMTEYPFRYNFNCTEHLALPGDQHLRLKNWFSFPFSQSVFPEVPEHDFYFDFEFSDAYNFLLNFKEPVELMNAGDFAKKINNDYFELESEIISNSQTSYLVKVKLLVKKKGIPKRNTLLLMDLVKELDALNDFSLELKRI